MGPGDPDRYEGRPLVRLLDLYVMSLLGEVAEGESLVCDRLVRSSFTTDPRDSWQRALEKQLELGPKIGDHITEMWHGFGAFEREHGRTADPGAFAMRLVDENFAPMIDRLP